jgi:hypothetical protein
MITFRTKASDFKSMITKDSRLPRTHARTFRVLLVRDCATATICESETIESYISIEKILRNMRLYLGKGAQSIAFTMFPWCCDGPDSRNGLALSVGKRLKFFRAHTWKLSRQITLEQLHPPLDAAPTVNMKYVRSKPAHSTLFYGYIARH